MCVFFFFNDTATTEIYTLSLHDALPISAQRRATRRRRQGGHRGDRHRGGASVSGLVRGLRAHGDRTAVCTETGRSEEHTSELQSRQYLVCRLLLEKKKIMNSRITTHNQT